MDPGKAQHRSNQSISIKRSASVNDLDVTDAELSLHVHKSGTLNRREINDGRPTQKPHEKSRLLHEVETEEEDPYLPSTGQDTKTKNLDNDVVTIPESAGEGWRIFFVLKILVMLFLCLAALVVGQSSWIKFPPGGIFENIAGLVVGCTVQIAIFAPIELGRRLCQALFAWRLSHRGMTQREMVTAWSTIYSNNYRGIEDAHWRMGPVTFLLLTLYIAEAFVIGSIGSLYLSSPFPSLRAAGHMPAYGPMQIQVTSQYDADDAYEEALTAVLQLGRLYDPLSLSAILVPPETKCAGPDAPIGWQLACSDIVVSSVTLPNIQETTEVDPTWVSVTPGDTYTGAMSTVGVTASCGPLPLQNTFVDWTGGGADGATVTVEFEDGNEISNAAYMYFVGRSDFTTPTMQVLTMGTGLNDYEPYIGADGAMYLAMTGYNFAAPIRNFTTLQAPLDNGTFRNVSFALCKIQVNIGLTNAEVFINSTEPSRVATLLSAERIGHRQLFNMSLADSGFGGGTSGYGTAHFLLQALQMVTCDLMPCAPSSTSVPGFAVLTGMVSGAGSSYTIPDLFSVTSALARLSTLYLAAYVEQSDVFDYDPTSITRATTNVLLAKLNTNVACNAILYLGAVSSALILCMHFYGHLGGGGFSWYFSPQALWITESVYTLLESLDKLRGNDYDEDCGRFAKNTAPGALRFLASRRVIVGCRDPNNGAFLLSAENRLSLFVFALTTGIAVSAAVSFLHSVLSVGGLKPTFTSAPVSDNALSSRKQVETVTQKLEREFQLSTAIGLKRDGTTLKTIPSFVVRRPTGEEVGTYLALDLGGSNFRVCEVSLQGKGQDVGIVEGGKDRWPTLALGELVRYIMVDLIATGNLVAGRSCESLEVEHSFDTALMSRIERDHSIELMDVRSVLEDLFGVKKTTLSDRRLVKRVCELIGTRAARLAAVGVASVVTKTNKLSGCSVAVDGSVFEHYPHFRTRMQDGLRELLGVSSESIVLAQARDGSGQGAALIAALADSASEEVVV
ncbi:hexokinase A [Thoreauomyces humboldtii]|nr:hexokinase A [Thoreauomyces humboldtii]